MKLKIIFPNKSSYLGLFLGISLSVYFLISNNYAWLESILGLSACGTIYLIGERM